MCFGRKKNKDKGFEEEICLSGSVEQVKEFSHKWLQMMPEKYILTREIYDDTDDMLHFRLVIGSNKSVVSDFDLTLKYTPIEGYGVKLYARMTGVGVVLSSKQFFKDYIKEFGELKPEDMR